MTIGSIIRPFDSPLSLSASKGERLAQDRPLYSFDLAYIHDAGFGDFAERAAPEVIRILRRHGIRPPASKRGHSSTRLARPERGRGTTGSGRAGRIVEVGCGSGTLARRLVDARYGVVGFDISPAMIRLARAKVPEATFRVASLTEARIPQCDAVVAIGEVVTYVPARGGVTGLPAALRTFFSRVHDALEPGGLFIFDFIESGVRRTYPPKCHSGRDWVIAVHAELDRPGQVLTRRMIAIRKVGRQYRRSQEFHLVRIYSRRAVATALADAGFTASMSRSYGRYRLMPGIVAVIAKRQA
jgi:SAM-dependent methyltransferase